MIHSFIKKASENKTLVFILFTSFILRILFSMDNAKVLFLDIDAYDTTALHLMKRGIWGIGTYHAPGYPFLLAAIYKLTGYGYRHVYFFQSLAGMLNTLLIYLIAGNAFNKRTAKIAAGLSLLYWPLTLYSGILLSETFFIFSLLLGIYLFLLAMDTSRKVYFIFSSFFFAISALTRSINLLLIFIIPVVYLLMNRRRPIHALKHAVIFVTVFAMTLSPWIIRNYVMLKEFIPVDSLGGLNLYIGNHENANGLFMDVAQDKAFNVPEKEMTGKSEFQRAVIRDKQMKTAAVQYILGHPAAFRDLTLKRAGLFIAFDFRELDWVLTDYMEKNAIFRFTIWKTVMYYSDILFFIIGLMGLFCLLKNGKGRILLGFTLYYFLLTSVFYISARYRLPVMPFLSVAAAYLIERLMVTSRQMFGKKRQAT